MGTGVLTSLFGILLLCYYAFASTDQKNITAESGQDVTLTCRAPNKNIIGVEWSRADLEPEYILVYRDGHFVPGDQHPSFKNRVDLQDRQMKDGDVSLILKNVTINDTGTYKCRVFMEETSRRKRAHLGVDLISIVSLRVVDPPGHTGGHTEDGGKEAEVSRGHFWPVAFTLLLLGLIVVALVIASKQPKKNVSNHPPSDEPADICSEIRVG